MAGVSLTAEPALGRLVSVLTGLAQRPVLIDDSEEIQRKAPEPVTNPHGSMLITPSGDVKPRIKPRIKLRIRPCFKGLVCLEVGPMLLLLLQQWQRQAGMG